MADTTLRPPTLDVLRARRAEILRLAEQYGVANVRVFGSVARGEAAAGSDVDLLVSAASGVSMFDLVGLWLDLQELLGCEVSLVTDDEEDHPRRQHFLQNIQHDAVTL